MSPHELYFGKKPNLAHWRISGSIEYVHVPKEKSRKLDAKAEKCILVGYSDEQKGYKCYNPRTKEVRVVALLRACVEKGGTTGVLD